MTLEEKSIQVSKDGPYMVKWNVPIDEQSYTQDKNWISLDCEKVRDFPPMKVTYLCRCWKSKTKPYCNGTHKDIHFDWTETANDKNYFDKVQKYEWPEVDLLDCEEYCVWARFCDAYKRVWNMVVTPKNHEETKLAIDEAIKCPWGRLTIVEKGWKIVEPKLNQEISALNDPFLWVRWPLQVKWWIPIISSSWKEYEVRNRVALCRCWFSENKPFCDGSHLQDKYEGNGLENE
jgi:CDGSH-type Zn-finger protein